MIRHREILRATWGIFHNAIASLNLTSEQRTRLLNLLVARNEAKWDAHYVSIDLGVTDQKEKDRAAYEAYLSFSSEIRDLVGNEGAQALYHAESFSGWRQNLHGTVTADLAIDGVPITLETESALANIYLDVLNGPEESRPRNSVPLPVDPQGALSETDQTILDRASNVLTPQQVSALKKSLVASRKEKTFLSEADGPRQATVLTPSTAKIASPGGGPSSKTSQSADALRVANDDVIRHRAMLRNTWLNFHEVIASFDLTPENQTRLLNLIAAQGEAIIDAHAAAQDIGETDQKNLNRSEVDAYSSLTFEIAELIGHAGVRALEHNQSLLGARQIVRDSFGVDLAMAGIPLTPDQEIAMAQIYHDAISWPFKTSPDKNGQVPVDTQTGLSEIDRRILDNASAVLSPDQISVLRKSLVTTQEEMQLLIASRGKNAP